MAMKFKEQVENYLYGLFDEKEVAEKIKLKDMQKRVNEHLEENEKFRRDKYKPNKKIQHASSFYWFGKFLCGRLGIAALASRRVVQYMLQKRSSFYAKIYNMFFMSKKEAIMANLSKIKRDSLIDKIENLKLKNKKDEDTILLLNEIINELTGKKYGLVWEQHEENVDKKMGTAIPVFD